MMLTKSIRDNVTIIWKMPLLVKHTNNSQQKWIRVSDTLLCSPEVAIRINLYILISMLLHVSVASISWGTSLQQFLSIKILINAQNVSKIGRQLPLSQFELSKQCTYASIVSWNMCSPFKCRFWITSFSFNNFFICIFIIGILFRFRYFNNQGVWV